MRRASKILTRMRFDQEASGRAGGEHYLAALFAVQALHLGKGKPFNAFYNKIAKDILRCQNKDGSWTGYHCITARVFCTACAVMAMLTPNKLLRMVDR